MSLKNVEIDNKERLLKGFIETCTAVGKTMGAEGSLAIYESEIMSVPIITKDGISVAKSIYYKDKHMSMGNFMAKQAALRTALEVGDSTSTSLVLAKSIVETALAKKEFLFKLLYKKPIYNKKVEEGFEIALEEVKNRLKRLSKPTTDEDILKIATISANNNREIGEIILKAYKAVGSGGVVDFKENYDTTKTELQITNGMLLPKGMVNPLLKNSNNGNFEADDVLVVIYNGYEIGKSKEVFDFINANQNKSILLIVERTQDEDFARRIVSGNQNGFNICLIECPFFDTQREMLLEDIALYSGAEVFIQGSSKEVKAGKLDRVVITNNTSSLIKKDIPEVVKDKIEALEVELKETKDKQFIKRRIQLLKGVAATINVGAVTETERREIFDRVEDAVHAVKAAVDEGWVAGGGATFANISNTMKRSFGNSDVQLGYNILKKSILSPFYQICENANRNGDSYVSFSVSYGFGYNAKKDEVSNLIEDGIIDSVKSLRISLENAVSVAKLLLNIKVVVSLE